ncbi:MAG: hypothetical protein HQL31_02275 [Planctomycetes bacterium]|nr:hypothetical protein [Planctomycetota bacterium]
MQALRTTLLLLGTLFILTPHGCPEIRLVRQRGETEVYPLFSAIHGGNTQLKPGQRLRTGTSGKSLFQVEASEAELGEDSLLLIEESAPGFCGQLFLIRGALKVEAKRLPLLVRTPSALVLIPAGNAEILVKKDRSLVLPKGESPLTITTNHALKKIHKGKQGMVSELGKIQIKDMQ